MYKGRGVKYELLWLRVSSRGFKYHDQFSLGNKLEFRMSSSWRLSTQTGALFGCESSDSTLKFVLKHPGVKFVRGNGHTESPWVGQRDPESKSKQFSGTIGDGRRSIQDTPRPLYVLFSLFLKPPQYLHSLVTIIIQKVVQWYLSLQVLCLRLSGSRGDPWDGTLVLDEEFPEGRSGWGSWFVGRDY